MAEIQKYALSLVTQFQAMEQLCAHELIAWESKT